MQVCNPYKSTTLNEYLFCFRISLLGKNNRKIMFKLLCKSYLQRPVYGLLLLLLLLLLQLFPPSCGVGQQLDRPDVLLSVQEFGICFRIPAITHILFTKYIHHGISHIHQQPLWLRLNVLTMDGTPISASLHMRHEDDRL